MYTLPFWAVGLSVRCDAARSDRPNVGCADADVVYASMAGHQRAHAETHPHHPGWFI